MLRFIAKHILKKAMNKNDIKENIFADMRKKAKESDNKLDDAGVEALAIAWDVIIPIIIGRL